MHRRHGAAVPNWLVAHRVRAHALSAAAREEEVDDSDGGDGEEDNGGHGLRPVHLLHVHHARVHLERTGRGAEKGRSSGISDRQRRNAGVLLWLAFSAAAAQRNDCHE